MSGELIPHFILYCSTGTNKCLLSQDVAGDVEDLCGIHVLGKKKVEERMRKRFHIAVFVERNDLIGTVFYRFHSPNYIDFPLQSAPFLFPFPLVSAFISFLNFCFLFTPHCHFDVYASFRWVFFVCLNKILYPRCHLSVRFYYGFSH